MKRPTIEEMKVLGFGERAAVRMAALMGEGLSFIDAVEYIVNEARPTIDERVADIERYLEGIGYSPLSPAYERPVIHENAANGT